MKDTIRGAAGHIQPVTLTIETLSEKLCELSVIGLDTKPGIFPCESVVSLIYTSGQSVQALISKS